MFYLVWLFFVLVVFLYYRSLVFPEAVNADVFRISLQVPIMFSFSSRDFIIHALKFPLEIRDISAFVFISFQVNTAIYCPIDSLMSLTASRNTQFHFFGT